MREFSSFYASFWTGETGKILRENQDAQTLAAFLFTNQHHNLIGLYYLPLQYASHETGLSIDRVSKAMEFLSKHRFAYYDAKTEHVWAVTLAQRQITSSPKAITGALKLLRAAPKSPLLDAFVRRYGANLERLKTPWEEPAAGTAPVASDTVSIPIPETSSESEVEVEQEEERERAGARPPLVSVPDELEPGEPQASDADRLTLAALVRTRFAQRYAEKLANPPGWSKSNLDQARVIADWLAPQGQSGQEYERLLARLLGNFFADDRMQTKGFPIAFLASDVAVFMNPPKKLPGRSGGGGGFTPPAPAEGFSGKEADLDELFGARKAPKGVANAR